MKQAGFTILLSLVGLLSFSQASQKKAPEPEIRKMNVFISDLMKKMTLEEKLGQLNLPVAGDITTGQATTSDFA
ncbi:MAG TPA: hypothetical protein VK907_02920, partial [Phnomibacter sp.]|nr:hypothetical protein [Phnomibacter sp.]